jgi:hypothetical protein
MSTATAQRANTTNANLNGNSGSGTQLAALPALAIAGPIAVQAARAAAAVAIQYGRRYAPIAATGFTAGAAVGYAGLDPVSSDLAQTAAWQVFQRRFPTRAALPFAKEVFDQSFNLGTIAGQQARTLLGSNQTSPSTREVAVALKDTSVGQSGSDGYVIGAASAANANRNQNTQRQAPSVGIA